MNIAQTLYLAEGRAFLQKLLLCQHDLGCLHFSEIANEICLDIFQRFSVAEPFQICLQLFPTIRGRVACIVFLPLRFRNRSHIRHIAHRLKSMAHQRGHHIDHGDVLHLRTLWDGHHFTHGIQHGLFRYLGKAQTRHNIDQFRVFLCQFEDRFI